MRGILLAVAILIGFVAIIAVYLRPVAGRRGDVVKSYFPNTANLEAIADNGEYCILRIRWLGSTRFDVIDLRNGRTSGMNVPDGTTRVFPIKGADADYVASGKGWSAAIRGADGAEVWRFELPDSRTSVAAASHSGAVLLTAQGKGRARSSEYCLVKPSDGQTTKLLETDRAYGASFSPDGRIVSVWLDNAVLLYDVASGEKRAEVRDLPNTDRGYGFAWLSPTRFAIDENDGVGLYSVGAGKLSPSHRIPGAHAVSKDEKTAVYLTGLTVELRESSPNKKGRLLKTWQLPRGYPAWLKILPDGKSVLNVHENGEIRHLK